jgi:lipopolysaccharide transport system permease protein
MSDLVSAKWRTLYALNPMVAVIDGFRWSIMGAAMPISVTSTVIGVLVAALIIVTGISYFRREEDVMADRI